MTKIKLGIAGTHSTGKSTLITQLGTTLTERGFRVKCVSDLATEASNTGFPILQNHTFESTLWIMSRGISCELEASLQADVVLVDRPIMDAMAYLLAALNHRGCKLSPDESKYLFDLAQHHARTYAIICKTVLDSKIPLGAGRDQDLTFRAAVDGQFQSVFSKISVSPRIVETQSEFINFLVRDIEAALQS
ncbi:MAG: hypothetical protein NPIRA01_37540 [Nitrospirales bacterium]|nr:MAG: hypothetical protein NPIRA01_37540 [Nitrospirales bacterium]